MADGIFGVLDLLVLVAAGLGLVWASARLVVLAFAPQLRGRRPFRIRQGYSVRGGVWESVFWLAWSVGMLGNGLGPRSGWFTLLTLAALVGILVLAFSRRSTRAG
ncbi:hypothetical protein [Xanthomonas sp. XNM01]|uniref:hypothetical protein n=1 Tax=Xanthomonas sp. XNM01 TaxID=2769289 RepID=UPI0017836207|nr:hypothetical protein [Xanthomonas sp. XNM01]MBD9368915.1 hypothetical protein [Xanthomonas sp. XNM01]